jgi:hypothetical protein
VPAATPAAGRTGPSGDLVDTLRSLWSELLDYPACDTDANFFLLGGTSLQAGRLVSRIKGLCGVRVPLRYVFTSPTPATLAERIAQLPR